MNISMDLQNVLNLLVVWFLTTQTYLCYPRFNDDYKVSKISLDPVLQDYAKKLLDIGEEMPRPCRKDICYENTEWSDTKGEFVWPEITVSHKVELRCPFSFDIPVYTSRVCGLDKAGVAEWEPADWEDVCPDPPMARVIREMNAEVEALYYVPGDIKAEENKLYSKFFEKVINVFTKYRGTPVTIEDISQITYYMTFAIHMLQNNHQEIMYNMTSNLLHITDTLMDEDFISYFSYVLSNERFLYDQFVILLEILPYQIKRNEGEIGSVVLNNIMVYGISVTPETDDIIDITNGFNVNINSTLEVTTPNVSLHLGKIKQESGIPVDVGITILKSSQVLDDAFSWVIEVKAPEESIAVTQTTLISPNNTNYNTTNSTLNYIEKHEFTASIYPVDTIPVQIGVFHSIGGAIFLTSLEGKAEHIGITYQSYTADDSEHWESDGYLPVCVKSKSQGELHRWGNQDCTTVNVLNDNGYTTCYCEGYGAYGIFHEEKDYWDDPGAVYPEDAFVPIEKGDISAFLGFEYKKELEIIGNVLGVISLAGLLATITSYGIFRRTRRGTPTTILLNLCVALIVLSVLLFSVYFTGNVMTTKGCTATNTLRYYLVFVTLVWNGIEAFNMYLMLVKVFGSNISKFALKAGIIAWGVPALMVCVNFAINKKAFNGQYVLISEENGTCIYRCKLRDSTLYYGYIIPMALIIIHNFIIFGFVLKIICKQGSKLGKSERKRKLVQLTGAVATLVLLGMPWMFSVFGAIDATKSGDLAKAEGVFQVIFVVCVNLQGLFIFLFHCARNTQIRNSWSSAVRKSEDTAGGTRSTQFTSIQTTSTNQTATKKTVSPKRNTEKTEDYSDHI